MAYLINRNSPARFQCLHSLCKLINSKFGINNFFHLKDVKYVPNTINIHTYCDLLVHDDSLGIKYCPYKENPLSLAGCALTNGLNDDSTKSKEVSNSVNALEALDLVERKNKNFRLTNKGKQFAETNFYSSEMNDVIKNLVLNYGVFVGFLAQISLLNKSNFSTDEIFVGYPNSNERTTSNGHTFIISGGSEKDSNTRTKSCLLAWATTAGFICPTEILNQVRPNFSHVDSSVYTLSKNRNLRNYSLISLPSELFSGNFVTQKPLNYKNLTKNTGALRENNQQEIREFTMKVEHIIQNRRFAILYALNKSFRENTCLNINKFLTFLGNYPNFFVIESSSFSTVMYSEIYIAFMAGIPFSIESENCLKPMTGLNESELFIGAPSEVITLLNSFDN